MINAVKSPADRKSKTMTSLSPERGNLDRHTFPERAKREDVPGSGHWVGAGDETSPSVAWNGLPVLPACEGPPWKAGFGVQFERRGSFHA